jgi:hypothetical protein
MAYSNSDDTVDMFPRLRQRKIIRDHNFLTWAINNKKALMNSCAKVSCSIPIEMNIKENRYNMSKVYTDRFSKDYPCLIAELGAVGYDMIYIKTNEKISNKSQNELFQEMGVRGRLNAPKTIILKNSRGENKGEMPEFDWLMACQRGLDTENNCVAVGYGVASYETIEKHTSVVSGEILVKLYDDEWDYFSGVHSFKISPGIIKQASDFFKYIEELRMKGQIKLGDEAQLQYL